MLINIQVRCYRKTINKHATMPRESNVAKAERIKRLIARFRETYPSAHCELNHADPLQLLISTILSAQCTDERVNVVTAQLFARYRTAADFAQAPIADLEEAVKSTGFFHNKARNIKSCCQALVEKHGGRVPATMDELTALDGVGARRPTSCLATPSTSIAGWWWIHTSPAWPIASA